MDIRPGQHVFTDWEIVEKIGSGASATVYLIRKKSHGVTLNAALKVVKIPESPDILAALKKEGFNERSTLDYLNKVVKDYEDEIRIMISLKDATNIVSCEDFFEEIDSSALKWTVGIRMELLQSVSEYRHTHDLTEADVYRMAFVFLAIWKAAEGAISVDSLRSVSRAFMARPIVQKLVGGKDLNRPEDMRAMKTKFHKMQEWADAHQQYRDRTWDFNFDEAKHRDGSYYHFTRCPLEKFARENGFLEVLPVACELDYLTTAANHGVLHRDYTLATGGPICDYWIVPDQIRNPE